MVRCQDVAPPLSFLHVYGHQRAVTVRCLIASYTAIVAFDGRVYKKDRPITEDQRRREGGETE